MVRHLAAGLNRSRHSRSMPTCVPKARTARWLARSSRAPSTTADGLILGRRKRCLRARPCAGDEDLRGAFVASSTPCAIPKNLPDGALKQMRTLKARMESERLPRGSGPRRHLKLGPGGLSDVEWTVQLSPVASTARVCRRSAPRRPWPRSRRAARRDYSRRRTRRRSRPRGRRHGFARGHGGTRHGEATPTCLPSDVRELGVLADITEAGVSGAQLDEAYARATRQRARSRSASSMGGSQA